MALRGNTPSGQSHLQGKLSGEYHWRTESHSGRQCARRASQWPFGGTPLRARPKFSLLPSSSPSPLYSPCQHSQRPLDFQIGLCRCSEHFTLFDIRSSGDFSAGKPHVSVDGPHVFLHKFCADDRLGLGQDGCSRTSKDVSWDWSRESRLRRFALGQAFSKTRNLALEIKGSNEHFCKISNVVNVPHEGGGVKFDFVVKPLDFKGGIFWSEIAQEMSRRTVQEPPMSA